MTTYPVYPFIRLREFVLVGGFIVVLSMVAALLTGWAQEWMAISRAQRDIARTIPTLTAAERSTLANERWAQVVDGCWPPRAELLWATQGATFADSISQAQLACARRALDPLWDADAVDRTQRAVLVARAAERAGYRVEVAWTHPELFPRKPRQDPEPSAESLAYIRGPARRAPASPEGNTTSRPMASWVAFQASYASGPAIFR